MIYAKRDFFVRTRKGEYNIQMSLEWSNNWLNEEALNGKYSVSIFFLASPDWNDDSCTVKWISKDEANRILESDVSVESFLKESMLAALRTMEFTAPIEVKCV